MSKDKGKMKVEKDNAERWLLTYADLMNLLLIFFIVLYSMSMIDVKKFDQLAQSFRESLGTSSSNKYFSPGGGYNSLEQFTSIAQADTSKLTTQNETQKAEDIKNQVDQMVKANNLGNNITVTSEERGIKISIAANFLFLSGSAEITPLAYSVLQGIGKTLLAFKGNTISIEGHTDNEPISTAQFPSNWELSSSRATNVLEHILDNSELDPVNFSAVGYGEYHPLVPNNSEENKARNRRVDIVILREDPSTAEVKN